MNAPERTAFLPDVQATEDPRKLAINAVGIKGVRYPVTLHTGKGVVPTIAMACSSVLTRSMSLNGHMTTRNLSKTWCAISRLPWMTIRA